MADYYSLISNAVAHLPSRTDEAARHAIYERARTFLQGLRTEYPSISEADLATEQLALERVIRRVEEDLLFSAMRRFALGQVSQQPQSHDAAVPAPNSDHDDRQKIALIAPQSRVINMIPKASRR
jgi:hypothetical protein